jgi:hypothetical protein
VAEPQVEQTGVPLKGCAVVSPAPPPSTPPRERGSGLVFYQKIVQPLVITAPVNSSVITGDYH